MNAIIPAVLLSIVAAAYGAFTLIAISGGGSGNSLQAAALCAAFAVVSASAAAFFWISLVKARRQSHRPSRAEVSR